MSELNTLEACILDYDLAGQNRFLKQLAESEWENLLQDASFLPLLAEHYMQALDFKRARAITQRLYRLGVTEKAALLEMRRMAQLGEYWGAMEHAQRYAKVAPASLRKFEVTNYGQMGRIRTARSILETLDIAEHERNYLSARLAWRTTSDRLH